MRAGVLVGLVVLGCAAAARADDAVKTRRPYTELDAEYNQARQRYLEVRDRILAVQNLLQRADLKLAPLRAAEAELERTCAPGNPRLGEARKAVREMIDELEVGENRVKLAQLVEKEVETKEAAIQSGNAALEAMLHFLDRMAEFWLKRDPQVAEVGSRSLVVMRELDKLESRGTTLLPAFTPLVAAPANPHQIDELVQIYEDDAKKCAELALSLGQRTERVAAQRDRLVKLQEDGVTLEHVTERVKALDGRLEELEAARSSATKRADGLKKEIDALNKKKAELEGGLDRDGTNNSDRK